MRGGGTDSPVWLRARASCSAIPKTKIVVVTRGRVGKDFASLENEGGAERWFRPHPGAQADSTSLGSRKSLVRVATEAGTAIK